MEKVRTRFAPSPTGFMHVGGLRTALYAYLFAKQNNGAFILRIEDTDLKRFVPGALELIYSTLKDSGIVVDEGPNEGGLYGPYIQTERKNIYLEHALKLVSLGKAYYCFCDSNRLETLGTDGIKKYDKHCLHLSKEEIENNLKNKDSYVIRQNMPTEGVSSFTDLVYGEVTIPNFELEDQVLIKSDGLPTYNFANVIDDHLMDITHVIRGNEYLSSTPKYNLLYEAFGWEIPKYIHLTPIMKNANQKLSKRFGDAHFDDFINKGYLPEAIINYIALLGWSPKGVKEIFSLEELIEVFSISGLSKSSCIFDIEKLNWVNSEYIKKMPFDKFMDKAKPYFEKSVINNLYDFNLFGELLQTRINIFSEIIEKVKFITEFNQIETSIFKNDRFKVDRNNCLLILSEYAKELSNIELTGENIDNCIGRISEKLSLKSGACYSVLRVCLTTHKITPGGVTEMTMILGKEESIRRIKKCIEWFENENERI